MIANKTEEIRDIAITWLAYLFASSKSDAPINWDKSDVPAIETPVPNEINRKLTGHTKAVAAKCIELILLTHTPSARL